MSNKIGDTSMAGDRILKLGDAVEPDDACNLRSALALIGANTGVPFKFSGKISLGVGAVAGFLPDIFDAGSSATPIGYAMPRNYEMTDLYLNLNVNTANVPVTITVMKNGVATLLIIAGIAGGTTGVTHFGLAPGSGISFAPDDLLDVKVSAGAGAGDVVVTAIVYGTQAP